MPACDEPPLCFPQSRIAMESCPTSPTGHHVVDVHKVQRDNIGGGRGRIGKQPSMGPAKPRGGINGVERQRPAKSFSRQVSLETGVAVLNMAGRNPTGDGGGGSSSNSNGASKEERGMLGRSGKSLGGMRDVSGGGVGEGGRKGDFSMFRTKSTLARQNSMLPVKKDGEIDLQNMEGNGGGGMEEEVNRSVPAGRYFAALRGPELDQVRVRETFLRLLRLRRLA